MIANERLTSYLHSLDKGHGSLCDELEKYGREHFVPVLRKETVSFLKTMVAVSRPENILEIGTAIGYSALLMSQMMPAECKITTIEKYEKRIPLALENIKRAGMEGRINLLAGDAGKILPGLTGDYDFIFMDGPKGQYLHWLPHLLRLMPKGGVLISDNVLQDGDIVESRYAVSRRNRTIHARMRDYLYILTHTDGLETTVVPLGDGLTISVKTKEEVMVG